MNLRQTAAQTVPGRRARSRLWLVSIHAAIALVALVSPGLAQWPVDAARDQEFEELAGQISRLRKSPKEWRDRLKAETLDPQALILPEDTDPLDVVLRRTGALVQYSSSSGRGSPPRR